MPRTPKTVSLVSVAESLDTGSAAGRLVINIMTAVSQWEREAIGERTATALRHKRASGRVFNHTPYGFERDGDNLTPCATEQAVISRMKMLRANGWTLQKIADTLNAEAVPTKTGAQWFHTTVGKVLSHATKAEKAAA